MKTNPTQDTPSPSTTSHHDTGESSLKPGRTGVEAVPLSRLRVVEERLRQNGEVIVANLAREFGVSEMTIRRDLTALEERGVAQRSHGGAILVDSTFSDPRFIESRLHQRAAKRRIAHRCAELLPKSGSLFVGGGTTTSEVVSCLRDRPDLNIFTSNLAAASEAMSGGASLSIIGGAVQGPTCSLVGELARASLALLWAERMVLGADAISAEGGITSHGGAEADVARMMIERTRGDLICVVDSTKWAALADHVVVPITRISMVITDGMPADEKARLTRLGVKVELVG
ncbi:MAG TPA: DeoR/GlpR family DNA-binding transcription regulator [Acidimicrobiales bacterium]|nr:DeoR/GlpR family DNA-binding transcription regulator [Acidimicrobiales bacterium]